MDVAMMAGIINSATSESKVIGYSSLKGGRFLVDEVKRFVTRNEVRFEVNTDYHFGGYAKSTPELEEFIENFRNDHVDVGVLVCPKRYNDWSYCYIYNHSRSYFRCFFILHL